MWLSIALIIIFLTAAAVILSLVPVTIYMDSERSGGRTTGNMRIGWLMFLLSYAFEDKQTEIHIFGIRIARFRNKDKPRVTEEKKEKKEKEKKGNTGKKIPVRNYLSLIEPGSRLIRRMSGAFRVSIRDFHVIYGMDDPGITGIITGFLHAITGFFTTGHNFRFTPNFRGLIMDWNVSGMVTLTPFKLFLPIALFLTNINVLKFGGKAIF